MKRENKYVRQGLLVFATVCAILLFYDTLFGRHMALRFGRQLLTALEPVLYGAFIAYLLAPMVNFFEDNLFASPVRKAREQGRMTAAGVRAVSLLMTWAVICVLFYLLASVLLPELYKSVLQLIGNVENYYNIISGWVERLLESNPAVESWVADQMDTAYEKATTWLEKEALPQAQTVMIVAAGGVKSIVNFLKTLLVGVIVSIYLLATKERCTAHARKIAYSIFSEQNIRWVLRGAHKVDGIFSGFVRGKLLDSLIIGIICGVCLSILRIPYAMLISVIVGITNIIPVFGPFFGAIPSAFILLLTDPTKCLIFIIFVIILQQVDGNIIGPKILGDSTGLSAFWVLFALLLFNHLMGFWGMLLGVPLFASFYYLLREFINARLRKKNLPVGTQEYVDVAGIDENGTISYIVPNTIEFHPLFHGEDSLLAQLKQRLKHPLPHSKAQDNAPDSSSEDDDQAP